MKNTAAPSHIARKSRRMSDRNFIVRPKSPIIRFFHRFGKAAVNDAYVKVSEKRMTGEKTFEDIYERLFAWSEERNFSGPDPFDGLNSRIYQWSPLKFFRPTRLAWMQMVK